MTGEALAWGVYDISELDWDCIGDCGISIRHLASLSSSHLGYD